MEKSTLYELNLDFTKELNYTKAIMARQGDKGVQVAVNTYLHGLPFVGEPDGTFTLKATTPSGKYVDASTTSVNDNHIVFTLDSRFLSEKGFYSHCYVEYRTANIAYTTQDITFFNATDSDIAQGQGDNYISQLEQLIELFNKTFDEFMQSIQAKADGLEIQLTNLDNKQKVLQAQLDKIQQQINELDLEAWKTEVNQYTDNTVNSAKTELKQYTDSQITPINTKLIKAQQDINNNTLLIQKNTNRVIGGYRVNDLMRKTHYSAHRGNNADFPENSSMAMKKVIRHKFSEFDVQTTSDGKWVVMHDATVDRMTNGTGRVDSFTYEELRKLRIDTGNNLATLPDWEKVIPNLDEAIKYNRMAGTIPMIEIKVDEGTTYTDEELADFVNQLKLNNLDKGGCIVISFSADVLRKLRSLSETLEIMWVTYDMSDATLNTCKELRMHVDPQYSHETVTRSQIQKYHDNGLLVSVWTCPDDKFADMEDRGVDIITTNSRSGDLKWGKLTLKNGFTGVTWAGYLPPCVEEITKGILRVSCTVLNGSNTQNTVIAEFPSWAQPYLNSASLGMVRTTSTIEQCSVDVIGKIAGTPSLVVGLNWNNRTSWAMINIDYKIL